MTAPQVSWIIPVHNGAPFLAEALASVSAQTVTDFEAIVLDDGSRDASAAIAREFATRDPRFRVVEKPNTGLVDTLNQGVSAARAPLIARMDADDICLPQRLERQLDFFAAHPTCVALGTLNIIIDQHGTEQRRTRRPFTVPAGPGDYPPERYRLTHPTVTFRRDVFAAAGGYSADFHAAEDYELWLRMSERGEIAELREPLLRYRVHSGSVTASAPDRQRLSCLRADLVTTLRRRGADTGALAPLHREQDIDSVVAAVGPVPGAPDPAVIRLRYAADMLRATLYRGAARERRRLAAQLARDAAAIAVTGGWRRDHRAAVIAAGREVARWAAVTALGRNR